MRKNSIVSIYIFLFLFTLIFTACSANMQVSTISTVSEFSNVKDALKFKGYKVTEIEPSDYDRTHSFFSVNARFIDADGNRISIYEFSNSTEAKAEAETISRDGLTIGENKISLSGKPHFYNADNLIVCYADNNEKFLSDLESIFGKPIIN